MTRRKYSEEHKQEAVALTSMPGAYWSVDIAGRDRLSSQLFLAPE